MLGVCRKRMKSKTGITCCSVPKCANTIQNRIPGLSFHNFPQNKNLRNIWITAIGRDRDKTWVYKKHASVCSDHFAEHDFIPNRVKKGLKKGVIPTLKLPLSDSILNVSALADPPTPDIKDEPISSSKSSQGLIPCIILTPIECHRSNEVERVKSASTFADNQSLRDFNEICRICLQHKSQLTSLIGSEHLDNFRLLTGLDVSLDDNYPKNICNDCYEQLSSAFPLKLRSHQAWQTLQQLPEKFEEIDEKTNEEEIGAAPTEEQPGEHLGEREKTVKSLQELPQNVTGQGKRQVNCKSCNASVLSLSVHYKQSKKCIKKTGKCRECTRNFKDLAVLDHYLTRHTFRFKHICHICCKKFKFSQSLKRHLESHQRPEVFGATKMEHLKPQPISHLTIVTPP